MVVAVMMKVTDGGGCDDDSDKILVMIMIMTLVERIDFC